MRDDSGTTSPDDDVRAELIAIEEDWARAIVSNDAERIASFMADDWVIVSESGVSPKEHFLSLVRSGELTHSAMEPAGEVRVRVYGDTAVLTGRVTNTAHHLGQRFGADEWTTDVFVRRVAAGCACSATSPRPPARWIDLSGGLGAGEQRLDGESG